MDDRKINSGASEFSCQKFFCQNAFLKEFEMPVSYAITFPRMFEAEILGSSKVRPRFPISLDLTGRWMTEKLTRERLNFPVKNFSVKSVVEGGRNACQLCDCLSPFV